MDDLTNRFSRLGQKIAEVSDRVADPATLPNARRRFLSGSSEADKRPWRLRDLPASLRALLGGAPGSARRPTLVAGLSLSFAAACLVALVLVFVWRRDPAISFTAGETSSPGAVGQWVAPEGEAALDLRFSEGTRVTVAPGARMRVTETSATGATLLIERGAIHAAITHRDERTRWSVQAGPFEVRVTGTAFEARWDPATETFELKMLEGSVVVSGPRLPSGRSVVAGEQLLVSTTRMELRAGALAAANDHATSGLRPPAAAGAASGGAPTAPPAACATVPAPPTASDAPVASAAPSGTAAASASGAEASWKALARAGKHREAMDAAEAAGFSAEVARASASELLALSDTARFAGRPARAKEALLAMRRRFGARGSSAFLLGKISADQLRSPGEAATWFEIYLQEEPGGPLAEQALGRLLEIRKRDAGAARLVAERYLARYPNGAYAALARSLAGPR